MEQYQCRLCLRINEVEQEADESASKCQHPLTFQVIMGFAITISTKSGEYFPSQGILFNMLSCLLFLSKVTAFTNQVGNAFTFDPTQSTKL